MTRRTIVVFAFAIVVMVVAGTSFIYKMTEFAATIPRDDVQGFGAVAVATYLIGMLPHRLRDPVGGGDREVPDIERPKLRMFELDREIERGGELLAERAPWLTIACRCVVPQGHEAPPARRTLPATSTTAATISTKPTRSRGGWRPSGSIFISFAITYLISNLIE